MFLIDKNLNPSVETKPDPRSIEGLIAWLETQDATTTYCYTDNGHCLVGQYLRFLGNTDPNVGPEFYYDDDHTRTPMPNGWDDVAQGFSHTFGAALDRARAYQARVRT